MAVTTERVSIVRAPFTVQGTIMLADLANLVDQALQAGADPNDYVQLEIAGVAEAPPGAVLIAEVSRP